jgi:hypothetical protein
VVPSNGHKIVTKCHRDVKSLENLGKWLHARFPVRRAHLALGLRATLAAVLALAAAQLAGLPLPLWLHAAIASTASQYMTASGAALLARSGPPSMASFERALAAYDAEVDAMRKEGMTSALPGDEAERFFAVGFAFEQMHQNFHDLARVVTEWAPLGRGRA